jgi:hypothetical protein
MASSAHFRPASRSTSSALLRTLSLAAGTCTIHPHRRRTAIAVLVSASPGPFYYVVAVLIRPMQTGFARRCTLRVSSGRTRIQSHASASKRRISSACSLPPEELNMHFYLELLLRSMYESNDDVFYFRRAKIRYQQCYELRTTAKSTNGRHYATSPWRYPKEVRDGIAQAICLVGANRDLDSSLANIPTVEKTSNESKT